VICDDPIGHNQPGTANVPNPTSNVPGRGTVVAEGSKANVQPSHLGPLGVAVGELVGVDGGWSARADAPVPPSVGASEAERDPLASALVVAIQEAAKAGQ
jgi:hypothetical protein